MDFSQIFKDQKFALSFEFFPPQTEKGEAALREHVAKLVDWQPAYLTCTYGAGGSTRDKTLRITSWLKTTFGRPVASHLTCVGSTRDDLTDYLEQAQRAGIDNIVALRGDPPAGDSSFQPVADGFTYANELVTLIRETFPKFGIAVGGYPETHQEAVNAEDDLRNLKRKVDAGSDVIITQLFYENTDFYRFRDRCVAAGIRVPIVPGILPITNLAQVQRISQLCGAGLPEKLVASLSEDDSPEGQYSKGVEFAVNQVEDLIASGLPGIHFYVLNKSQAADDILNAVQLPAR